jgi:hypothetical protein
MEITYRDLGLSPGCTMADLDAARVIYNQVTEGQQEVTLVLTDKDVSTTNITECGMKHVQYTAEFFILAHIVVLRLPGSKQDIFLKNR